MKNFRNEKIEKHVSLDGMMTFSKSKNGLHAMDFECCEDVNMDTFIGRCKVQRMRDGNVYITQLPKRRRNKPLYRDDNCSLSLGHDGRYYFVFSLPYNQVGELPQLLVRQASTIAHKVMMDLIGNY